MEEASRFSKTPKLHVVVQITEIVPSGIEGRAWEVHDVERNRGFRVTLNQRALEGTRSKPADEVREQAIEDAIGLAVERALQTPPEKVSGILYEVEVTSKDLVESAALRG